jgi:hypothetical protein
VIRVPVGAGCAVHGLEDLFVVSARTNKRSSSSLKYPRKGLGSLIMGMSSPGFTNLSSHVRELL